ncbi:MAG TPA: hypothetical protein VMW42_07830 [Desulfatiglandales bacterium]|nr:hypothetical protein [Desulfatiglandales bacterium]
MESAGAYEAKTHLYELLERVMKVEQITIAEQGLDNIVNTYLFCRYLGEQLWNRKSQKG